MNIQKTLLLACMSAVFAAMPATAQHKTKQKKTGISVEHRLYEGESFFKAKIKRPLYADQRWSIMWPENGVNCNVKKLQEAIIASLSDKHYPSIDAFVSFMENNFAGNGEWQKVAEMVETETSFDCEDEYNPFPQSIAYNVETTETGCEGIATYRISDVYDLGSGVGAGILFDDRYIMYDLYTGQVVKYEDIFKQGSEEAVARLLKTNAVNLNDYKTLINADFPPVHKDNFYLDHNYKTAFFIYGKYEVASGVDGVVKLGLSFDDLKPFMKGR
ncbi:DUF3298 domain-containing protein [Prevotella sp. OH937_COT-195]|uniref:DUF3298 domain-containing protein n=1 Tax=Prevotella sp. OH937_COT-195 TaxID=2491051 RepID=UPI000F6501B3|nr:DUF3298 domain-containing protein [Prevotella sp. OH937_COT-195]RRD02898.1 DUF3298 domain-containing protein [Prevotella sp. OH937_COT-195]